MAITAYTPESLMASRSTALSTKVNKLPSPCFIGKATERLSGIPLPTPASDGDPKKSLSSFFSSPDSTMVLLGAHTVNNGSVKRRNRSGEEGGEIWEYQQDSVNWFGLKIIPTLVCRIERNNLKNQSVVISILSTKTTVTGFGIVGKSAASMVEMATTDGRIEITWNENVSEGVYNIEADFHLNIRVRAYVPSGVRAMGSRLVGITCRRKLAQNLKNIRDDYVKWSKKL